MKFGLEFGIKNNAMIFNAQTFFSLMTFMGVKKVTKLNYKNLA